MGRGQQSVRRKPVAPVDLDVVLPKILWQLDNVNEKVAVSLIDPGRYNKLDRLAKSYLKEIHWPTLAQKDVLLEIIGTSTQTAFIVNYRCLVRLFEAILKERPFLVAHLEFLCHQEIARTLATKWRQMISDVLLIARRPSYLLRNKTEQPPWIFEAVSRLVLKTGVKQEVS